jgi:type II secretory pathway component PulF
VLEQLAQALSAGLPLRSLAASGALEPLPGPVARALRADIEADLPLSRSFERLGLLDEGTRALIRAAEVRGALPDALRLAAAQIATRRTLRNRLLLGLSYPILLLVAAVVVLPLPVAFGPGGMGAYLARVAPLLACVVTAVVLGVVVLPRQAPSSVLRRAVRWIGFRIPVAGQALLSDTLSAFLGVLGACLRAGLPARESLTLAAQAAAPHPAFEGAAGRLLAAVDRGDSLASALALIPAIPPVDLSQVRTAELSGALDQVLPALEARHRQRARAQWLVVAAVVAGVVFLGVVGMVVAQIVNGWVDVFRAQSQQIDRLVK